MRALELTKDIDGDGDALEVNEVLILLPFDPSLPLLAPFHFLSLVLSFSFFLEREWEGEEWESK
jgi:hypothetical protein